MSFDYHELQSCLFSWPSIQVPKLKADDSVFERIRQILALMETGEKLQRADFLPLIRHILMRKSLAEERDVELRMPLGSLWPSISEWEAHGIKAMTVGSGSLLLKALPWDPTWIGGGDGGVFTDAFSSKNVREEQPCPADPFIAAATGYAHYSSPGQREAVRAAFLIPAGETLIVNLPTGSGKSLVGQVPSLVHFQEGNLTLFVVPTVALAIDQERQMKKYFQRSKFVNQDWPLAWHSDSSKEDRSEIRKRMREGTQRILFVSPEALTTSLLRSVFDVAKSGMLRYLVIDEAHLVTQWGDEFRPAFQALAGLRNSLLQLLKVEKIVAFRTLLLSATFTPETIETLADLFGPADFVQMVSAVHLRPEPQYWFSHVGSIDERIDQILEALRHAPRPFILYVTKREDASTWQNILRDRAGYQRVERYDGDTKGSKRRDIISSWTDDELDGIVATSAFGVGIDKADVRTIIHATIPETLDRYYQEVGRGGRDGKSSISLLVYTDSDWFLSKRMARPKLISDELGYARWEAIYKSMSTDGDHESIFQINIEAIRDGRKNSNDEDVRWNMRTLLLMSRAGFLELGVEPNSIEENTDTDEDVSLLAAMSCIRIRLLRFDHLQKDAWESTISNSRVKTLNSASKNLILMKGILEDGCEISSVLADLYSNNLGKWIVDVTTVCGGCPSDRFSTRNTHYHLPVPSSVHRISKINFDQWRKTFPYLDSGFVSVFYDIEDRSSSIIRFLKWLISECGLQEICIDDLSLLAQHPDFKNLHLRSPTGILLQRNIQQLDEEPYSPLVRVTFFDQSVTPQQIDRISLIQRPMHFVFYLNSTRDPNHLGRLLSDSARNSSKLSQLNVQIFQ